MKEKKKRPYRMALALFMATVMTVSACMPAFAANTTMTGREQAAPTATVSLASEARTTDFNRGWTFKVWLNAGKNKTTYSESDTAVAAKNFDDSSWRKLDLPHDWSIEQDFTSDVSVEYGALPTGIGWYRKDFTLPAAYEGKRICVDFDGVFANSAVYVNGQKVGDYYYGYNAFSFDITDYVTCGEDVENVIAVKVNSPINGSRWYTGSGIYRDVHLTVTDPVHVAQYGTAIYTPDIESEYADGIVTVHADTTVENERTERVQAIVRSTILNYEDGSVFSGAQPQESNPVEIAAGGKVDIRQTIPAADPALWSVDSPNLYRMKTEVLVDGVVVDTYESRFGFT